MLCVIFCWWPDSNCRPLRLEATALPTEPHLLDYCLPIIISVTIFVENFKSLAKSLNVYLVFGNIWNLLWPIFGQIFIVANGHHPVVLIIICNFNFLSIITSFSILTLKWISTRVTRWLDFFSTFDFLRQWKFAK